MNWQTKSDEKLPYPSADMFPRSCTVVRDSMAVLGVLWPDTLNSLWITTSDSACISEEPISWVVFSQAVNRLPDSSSTPERKGTVDFMIGDGGNQGLLRIES